MAGGVGWGGVTERSKSLQHRSGIIIISSDRLERSLVASPPQNHHNAPPHPHTPTHPPTHTHTGPPLQLKSIKKELGLEKDEKTALVQRCVCVCVCMWWWWGGEDGAGEGRIDGAAVVLRWCCGEVRGVYVWVTPPTPHPTPHTHTHTPSLPPRFRERLEPLEGRIPEAAVKVIEEELEKLQVGLSPGGVGQVGGGPGFHEGRRLEKLRFCFLFSCFYPSHPRWRLQWMHCRVWVAVSGSPSGWVGTQWTG